MKTKGLLTAIILLSIFAFNITGLKAQDVLNGVYVKEHVKDRKPIPYQYLRESDVMWSKTIWRVIELKEKMNHSLYYPEEPIGERKSLISLLMWAIQNQGLTAYNYSTYDEFATVMTMKEIEERFGAKDEVVMVEDVENPDGPMIEKTIEGSYNTSDVKQYLVKELWFFDKQRSVLEVRIIGLCPILFSTRTNEEGDDGGEEAIEKKKLFWVYFPEARKIFANNEVFNPFNDAERKSYDDIFFKRLFSSYIVQESNAYNDRLIEEYTVGMEALLEADRIKESIFNFEQDLWEY
ncbi:MAG: gliding motility protein GldN [Bacteroidales bacterium]|nr:gliding motility protein GldN [Bacteroidales bacterium]MBN2755886.1 gliding motility protein GldN [Bacteroidales bacterium]